MEESCVSKTQKSTYTKKQIEDDAHFFDQEGILHREFVPPGMTVNADFYCDVLRSVHENVRCKRPQKWQNQKLIIHHDNALAHRSFKVS